MTHAKLYRNTRILLSIAAVAIGSITGALAADSSSSGVLGLFTVKDGAAFDSAILAFSRDIESRGCVVRRVGTIGGQNGNMEIAAPNRFLVLDCATPMLRRAETRAVFKILDGATDRMALLEGEAETFPAEQSATPAAERAYVLKLSRYTNKDPDGRDRDLADIRAVAAGRADRWRREVFLTVSHAVGMETPDEVAVIYYDSPEQGARFRKTNPDVLKSIGKFNKKHLSGYIYFSGAVSR